MDSEIHTRQQHRSQAAGRGGKLAGDAAVTEASACPLVDVSPGGCIPGMKHANQVCFITRPSQGLWPWRGRTILGAAASLGRGRCLERAMAVVCEWGEPLTTAPTAGHALSSTGRVPHAGPELLEGSARWAVAPQPSFGARPSVELQSVPSSVSSQEGPNRVPPVQLAWDLHRGPLLIYRHPFMTQRVREDPAPAGRSWPCGPRMPHGKALCPQQDQGQVRSCCVNGLRVSC